jgi:hypothetical protein
LCQPRDLVVVVTVAVAVCVADAPVTCMASGAGQIEGAGSTTVERDLASQPPAVAGGVVVTARVVQLVGGSAIGTGTGTGSGGSRAECDSVRGDVCV